MTKKRITKKTTTTGGCGDGENALKTQPDKPIPAIDFPSAIPVGERLGLMHKLAGLNEAMRSDIIATLANKLARVAEGKSEPVADVQAYAAGLIRRAKMNALDVPQAVVESRKNDGIAAKIDELKAGLASGGQLFVDEVMAELESGSLVRLPGGCANLAQLISGGAAVEVRDA